MDKNEISTTSCKVKILIRVLASISRFKKLYRKLSMKSLKKTFSAGTLCVFLLILIVYELYQFSFAPNYRYTNFITEQSSETTKSYVVPLKHIPLNEIYSESSDKDLDVSIEFEDSKQGYMIDTPGCRIPVAIVNYENIKEFKMETCGTRAIFLRRINETSIHMSIKEKILKSYMKMLSIYNCCYMFFQRSSNPGFQYRKLRYTNCKEFHDDEIIFLRSDFINVRCFQYINNRSLLIYDDMYAFCKKRKIKSKINNRTKFNVLVLGMDSMSLSRFVQTMTRTVSFLKNNYWPGFRGYHKIGENTFPNLMAVLMGKNLSTIAQKCSGKMDQCNDLLMWSIFKNSGYVTAYGEDYSQLPNIFSRSFTFHRPPTDHYMRTFFLKGEREIGNHSLWCNGKIPSSQQLLDYAVDFVLTYRNDAFFGFFWMNSYSHNINNKPQRADMFFENFFNRLTYTGVLDNTFVIFLSDHGIRFGIHRLKVESYYDDRMPFLFVWPPRLFKMRYPEKLQSLLINQFRLLTPYDLFDTMLEIRGLSIDNKAQKMESPKKYQSIFSIVSANRTCQDIGIHDKWCSCHKLYPLDIEDTEGVKAVRFVASYIQNIITNIQTKRCWSCTSLAFNNVTRINFYYDKNKVNLYYVIAFSMSPNNILYEATVQRKDTELALVGAVSIISHYSGFGDCTLNAEDTIFCVCQKENNCRL